MGPIDWPLPASCLQADPMTLAPALSFGVPHWLADSWLGGPSLTGGEWGVLFGQAPPTHPGFPPGRRILSGLVHS